MARAAGIDGPDFADGDLAELDGGAGDAWCRQDSTRSSDPSAMVRFHEHIPRQP